jgi:hypothetical protein
LPGAPKSSQQTSRPPPQQQFQKPQKQIQKPVKREPDFPSLGSDSASRRHGSDNLLSNFRSVETVPQYRNLPGQGPAWQPSQPSSQTTSEPAKKPEKVKKNKEAPAPFVEDFPDLGPSQGPSTSDSTSAQNGAKKKTKPKKNGGAPGFMIGEDLITAPEPVRGNSLRKFREI